MKLRKINTISIIIFNFFSVQFCTAVEKYILQFSLLWSLHQKAMIVAVLFIKSSTMKRDKHIFNDLFVLEGCIQ